MPVSYIDVPQGIRIGAEKKLWCSTRARGFVKARNQRRSMV